MIWNTVRKDVEKFLLTDAVVCYQQMTAQHDWRIDESEESMLFAETIYEFTLESIFEVFVMDEELIMNNEMNYTDDFKEVEGNDSSEYDEPEEKKERTEYFIPIDYKIKG